MNIAYTWRAGIFVVREVLLLAGVLALMLSALMHPMHQASAHASDAVYSVTYQSFCGDYEPHEAAAGPCHACRVEPVDLPANCAVAEPVQFVAHVVPDFAPAPDLSRQTFHQRPPLRAPPLHV